MPCSGELHGLTLLTVEKEAASEGKVATRHPTSRPLAPGCVSSSPLGDETGMAAVGRRHSTLQ